jgi:hypothetical protein
MESQYLATLTQQKINCVSPSKNKENILNYFELVYFAETKKVWIDDVKK